MGLGDKVLKTMTDWIQGVFNKIIDWYTPKMTERIRMDVVKSLLEPKLFKTPEVQKVVEGLGKEMGHSPNTAGEFAYTLAKVFEGFASKMDFEALSTMKITDKTPTTRDLFRLMARNTDLCLLSQIFGIAGEFIPMTELGKMGEELRAYLNYSGLQQSGGLGYGMIFSNALSPSIVQEVNAQHPITPIPISDLFRLWHRGLVPDAQLQDELLKYGFRLSSQEQMKKGSWFYPSGEDFIRFSVRDVFNPKVVESSKLDDMYPELMEPEVLKSGMSPEYFRWFWRAHWILPSPQMGYEMLHRRVIDLDGLKSLLKVADYAPGWVDKMIAISYNPLTRVDARRMFLEGVLSDQEFLDSMGDLGYNDVNCKRLLAWVKKEYMTASKDLTQTQLIQAYNLGLSSRDQTLKNLGNLGYDSTESEMVLALEDNKAVQKRLVEETEALRYLYQVDQLTEKEFIEKMSKLGVPTAKALTEVAKAKTDRLKSVKSPSKEDILGWLAKDQVTKTWASTELRKLGYSPVYVTLYIGEKAV
jgi:hypothetical protein